MRGNRAHLLLMPVYREFPRLLSLCILWGAVYLFRAQQAVKDDDGGAPTPPRRLNRPPNTPSLPPLPSPGSSALGDPVQHPAQPGEREIARHSTPAISHRLNLPQQTGTNAFPTGILPTTSLISRPTFPSNESQHSSLVQIYAQCSHPTATILTANLTAKLVENERHRRTSADKQRTRTGLPGLLSSTICQGSSPVLY